MTPTCNNLIKCNLVNNQWWCNKVTLNKVSLNKVSLNKECLNRDTTLTNLKWWWFKVTLLTLWVLWRSWWLFQECSSNKNSSFLKLFLDVKLKTNTSFMLQIKTVTWKRRSLSSRLRRNLVSAPVNSYLETADPSRLKLSMKPKVQVPLKDKTPSNSPENMLALTYA